VIPGQPGIAGGGGARNLRGRKLSGALSDEVDAGSSQKMRQKLKIWSALRWQRDREVL
jgi:hypothetical protein